MEPNKFEFTPRSSSGKTISDIEKENNSTKEINLKEFSDKKKKLLNQLLLGKLMDIVGSDKMFELIKECKEELKDIE